MKKLVWFNFGLIVGLTLLSFAKASIPSSGRLTDDTAIDQRVSEIRVKKQAQLDLDLEIAHLSRLEKKYEERLGLPVRPGSQSHASHLKMRPAIQRISNQK
ncbi:MAG: hypothetical protein ACO3A2_11230, partial [Bdellovibrionia bacterium]